MRWHVLDWRALLRRVGCSVVGGLFVIWIGQYLFDSEYASRATARLLAPILAAGYGPGNADKVSVVLVDEPSLAQSNVTWPPKYGYHANVLDAIAQYGPKAIFVDVLFVDRRNDPSIDRLVQTLCEIKASGIPVFLASDITEGSVGLRQELKGECAIPVAVEYEPDGIDHLAREYRLLHAGPDGAGVESPALGMYRLLNRAEAPGSEEELLDTPMSVVWGVRSAVDARQNLLYTKEGEPACQPYLSAERAAVYGLLLPSALPACAFHPTVRAYEFRAPDAAQARELSGRLKGKVVFYGASLASTGDFLTSPLHGRLPGVYFHAMAYDNLLTYGKAWKKSVEFAIDRAHAGYVLTIAVLIALSVSLFSFGHQALSARVDQAALGIERQGTLAGRVQACLVLWGWRGAAIARAVLVALALTFIGHYWLNLGVFSYIEIVGAALALELFDIGESISEVVFGNSHGERK